MANEATIQSSLTITKGNLSYQSKPTSFRADVSGTKGPTPGALTVSTVGTDVSFAQLTTPALCRISNLDTTNYLTYGIWDSQTDTFYPLGEVLPGESYILRLSRDLAEEYGTGPGTGTTGLATNNLRLRAYNQPLVAVVEAFEA